MKVDEVLNAFPAGSPFPALLGELLTVGTIDTEAEFEIYRRISDLDRSDSMQDSRQPSWEISEADAHGILQAVISLEFPLPRDAWDGLENLISLLWRSPHASLTSDVARSYALLSFEFY